MTGETAVLGPALPGDAGELARLEAACFAHPRSEAALLGEIGQPERYLLVAAKQAGELLGYAGLEYVLDGALLPHPGGPGGKRRRHRPLPLPGL